MKYVTIVWDGNNFTVPSEMGVPRDDQLQGTWIDKLAELSGRICYDSMNSKAKGRDSVEYHKHIIEVGHLSVIEHPNLTFLIPNLELIDYLSCCESLLNRPGIWSIKGIKPGLKGMIFDLRITANMRAVYEWFKYPPANKWATLLGETIQNLAKEQAPLMFQDIKKHDVGLHQCKVVSPVYEQEIWVSIMLMNSSRGLSHECVRHKFHTAVSQRSSRFCDESDSHWDWHPLIKKNVIEDKDVLVTKEDKAYTLKDIENLCKEAYVVLVDNIQNKLVSDGTDKFTARKQARGAARGVLGNALDTEMIFSANLSQWKWMFKLRASSHADAEIRLAMNDAFEKISERFPDIFKNWTKHPCPDGVGYELRETPSIQSS